MKFNKAISGATPTYVRKARKSITNHENNNFWNRFSDTIAVKIKTSLSEQYENNNTNKIYQETVKKRKF